MRLGINLRQCNPRKIGGMENYTRQIIAGLAAAGHQLWLFLPDVAWDTFAEMPERITKIRIGSEATLLAAMHDLRLDVWYCPLLVLEPRFCPIPTAITIPDLQHEFFPEFFSAEVLAWRRENFAVSARIANVIFTLSEHAKETIVKTFDVDPGKVVITHCDIGADFPPPEPELVERNRRQHGDYLYYPANTWPHKDHQTLIEAMAILTRSRPHLRLVLTGSADNHHSRIVSEIRRLDLSDRVDIRGHVSTAELVALYAAARALVFPSRFEGFGIPLIEAMHLGCPIICSDATSLPEVGGDAVLLFRQGVPTDLVAKVDRLIDEPGLADELVKRGRIRRHRYRWEESVRTAIASLEGIVHPQHGVRTPLVTIVTPSYQQGRFIRATIESVLKQDYPTIEYIVMDGGSRDETVSILKEYGGRITWTSGKDKGQADAVNQGIQRARGEIIGWLNSDDLYEPGAIAMAVSYLIAHPEADAVYGAARYIDADGNDIGPYPTEAFNHERLAENCFICQPSLFVRRSALIAVGLLDINLHTCMDYDLWLKLSRRHPLAHIPAVLAHSRLYADNKTMGMRDKVYREIFATVRRHRGFVPQVWYAGLWHWRSGGAPTRMTKLRALMHFALGNWTRPRRVIRDMKQLLASLKSTKDTSGMGLVHGNRVLGTWHQDGWIGRECTWQIPRKSGELIVIEGSTDIPTPGQVLRISVDGVPVGEIPAPGGAFAWQAPLPPPQPMVGHACRICIQAQHIFIPSQIGINGDNRELSVRLARVDLTTNGA